VRTIVSVPLWLAIFSSMLTPSACRARRSLPAAGAPSASTASLGAPNVTAEPVPVPTGTSSSEPAFEVTHGQVPLALQRARAWIAKGRLDDAERVMLDGLVTKGEINLPTLAELAYLKFHRGDDSADVQNAFLMAASSNDQLLAAQAWYNVSQVYSKHNLPEAERAALARSLRLRDNTFVRSKLGGRSHCTAVVAESVVPIAAPSVAKDWVTACKALRYCREPKHYTEAQARSEVCVTQGANSQEPPQIHGCADSGPWDSVFWYSNDSYGRGWISQLSSGRLFVSAWEDGSFPATCRGTTPVSWEEAGTYALATVSVESLVEGFGLLTPQGDFDKGACLAPISTKVTAVWDRVSAKLLAAVAIADRDPVVVKLDVEARQLRLSGGSCCGYVPLDGTLRFIGAE